MESPRTTRIWRTALAVIALIGLSGFPETARSSPHEDVFTIFAQHIRQQVDRDKLAFVRASACTQWFYKRQQHKPPRSSVEGVRWAPPQRSELEHPRVVSATSDCETRYPGGLASVREDFSRTQSSLSMSLTFYEFALVGDRNDDGQYSPNELMDILQSLNLSSSREESAFTHATALNKTFDALHQTGELETLMTSMGILYEQGYRLTAADRAELNRVME